jgi:hypothetical protein
VNVRGDLTASTQSYGAAWELSRLALRVATKNQIIKALRGQLAALEEENRMYRQLLGNGEDNSLG